MKQSWMDFVQIGLNNQNYTIINVNFKQIKNTIQNFIIFIYFYLINYN